MFINTAIEYTKDQVNSPVKNFADDSVFFPLDLNRQSQANLYLRKGDLGIGKSWYVGGASEYHFIKVEDVREYYEPWSMATASLDNMRVARIYLRLDDKIEHTEVHFFGILDLFSQIGGLASFLVKLGMVLTNYLAYDFLIANFVRELFMIRNNVDQAFSDSDEKSRKNTKRRLFKHYSNILTDYSKESNVSLDSIDISNVVHEASQVKEFRINFTVYICFILQLLIRLFRCKCGN